MLDQKQLNKLFYWMSFVQKSRVDVYMNTKRLCYLTIGPGGPFCPEGPGDPCSP